MLPCGSLKAYCGSHVPILLGGAIFSFVPAVLSLRHTPSCDSLTVYECYDQFNEHRLRDLLPEHKSTEEIPAEYYEKLCNYMEPISPCRKYIEGNCTGEDQDKFSSSERAYTSLRRFFCNRTHVEAFLEADACTNNHTHFRCRGAAPIVKPTFAEDRPIECKYRKVLLSCAEKKAGPCGHRIGAFKTALTGFREMLGCSENGSSRIWSAYGLVMTAILLLSNIADISSVLL